MLFNSLQFVGFFAIILTLYELTRSSWRVRKWLLLLASYWFYMAWNPPFVLLLLGSTALDFVAGRQIAASTESRIRRGWLVASCLGNLGVLAAFKYGEFLAVNAWGVLPLPGDVPMIFRNIVLPVGISFYTFQSLSYTIDVYRDRDRVTHDLLDFALYVTFFPQLVAGPIIRSTDFLPQLVTPRSRTPEDIREGVDRIARGFVKKVLIADGLGPYVDLVFGAPESFGALNMTLAAYAYAFQIYGDFSGYSDIAIGLARILGFRVPDNFNLPYRAANPSEFWRRWHISLSTWLRDYLYIPLGGSRGTTTVTYRNLLLTMVLGGLWHGAAWNFILWGVFHGCWLAIHRGLSQGTESRLPRWVAVPATFHLVCLGWIIFRAPSVGHISSLVASLFDFTTPFYRVDVDVLVLLGLAFVAHILAGSQQLARIWGTVPVPARAVYYALVVIAIYVRGAETTQFIYFQF